MKRKDRYLAMFKLLGLSVRAQGKRVRFEDAVNWSMRYLRKDDRIVWYLSIIQRFALLQISGKSTYRNRKLRNKIERKLAGWKDDRITSDFHDFSIERWEHFANVQSVYMHPIMTDYSFHDHEELKPVPKPVDQVFEDFEKFENYLHSQPGSQRFCSDGAPVLEFPNGWAWFGVSEGFSTQEAMAMRHCGNGFGRKGDYLYSLREPVKKKAGKFWKPHLTFIANHGFLGEMKGFANQKPDPRFHPYVEALLKDKKIHGLLGGGYLPKNNFSFFDFEHDAKVRVLEAKPDFVFDPIEAQGNNVIEVSKTVQWQEVESSAMPESASSRVLAWPPKKNRWLVLRTPFHTSRKTYHQSLAWCWLSEGKISDLHTEEAELSPEALRSLLESPLVTSLSEDPLLENTRWSQLISQSQMTELVSRKPSFFAQSELQKVFELTGLNEGFSKVLNLRFGLKTQLSQDGLRLQSYDSLESFAGMSGIGSLHRKIVSLVEDCRGDVFDLDLFQIPWLSLRKDSQSEESYFLNLREDAVMHFFETLGLGSENDQDYAPLLQEIIYRFGPPDPSVLPSGLAA